MCLLYMPQTSGMKFPWALAKLWSGGVPFYLGGGGGGGHVCLYKKREARLLHVQYVLHLVHHKNHVYVKTGISQASMRTVVFY